MQRPFSQSILDQKMTGVLPVIPDIKIRSPGEGELLGKRCAKDYAAALQAAGARAVSVVTESTRYGGSPSLLTRVAALGMPVLRKDFLTTREGIRESLSMGASAVLLIASICESEAQLAALYTYALELGLDPLVEVHSEAELFAAKKLRAGLVGINNRDIASLSRTTAPFLRQKRSAVLRRRMPSLSAKAGSWKYRTHTAPQRLVPTPFWSVRRCCVRQIPRRSIERWPSA